jgi:hypothetical protein
VLRVGQFGVGLGERVCVLCVGQFGVGLGERVCSRWLCGACVCVCRHCVVGSRGN